MVFFRTGGATRCPDKREIPLLYAKFNVYLVRNVGIQPPKLSKFKISNFDHKFTPQRRLVCCIFTIVSAFVRDYR